MTRYEALKHAVKAHGDETDKCGELAVFHPIAVAEAAASHGRSENMSVDALFAVGMFHDVFEDTDGDVPMYALSGYENEAIMLLTKQQDETYAEYIDELSRCPLAAVVKLADLWHNLQPERQACLPSKERASLEKRYLKARDRIWEALGYEWWPSNVSSEGPDS